MVGRGKHVSTRVRILTVILAVTAAGMAVAGGVTLLLQRDSVLSENDERLRAQLSVMERQDPFASVDAFLNASQYRLPVQPNESAAAVSSGDVIKSTVGRGGIDLSAHPNLLTDVAASATRAEALITGTADTPDGLVQYAAQTIHTSDGDSATYLRAINASAELEAVTRAVVTYLITAAIALGAVGVVGWLLLGRLLLSPMKTLQTTAGSITIADLHRRVPTAGNDEIASAGHSVNAMLDRIEGSVDVQRQLLDDIRHELKTPITIVRGHLEMMDVHDPKDVESTREIGMSELDRMTRLVNDIDMLAAVEDDEFTMGTVDISQLTNRIGELVVAIPGHRWSVTANTPGRIRGNQDRMLQAWLALADNAAKYTPTGSPIELGSAQVDGGYTLWVRDYGPGIPPSARHRIFRRFDRGTGKRDVGGSGLGLAIVETIARAHGGSCTVTDTPGGGATFVIQVPSTLGSGVSSLPAPVRAGDVLQQREESG